jgi:multicomponent Na+:H+ antiporter subunit A
MAVATLLAAHLLPGLALLLGLRRRPAISVVLATVVMAATCVAVVASGRDGGSSETVSWLPSLGLNLRFQFDGLAVLMSVLVTVLGLAVLAFSLAYFEHDGTFARFVGLFAAFAGSMTGLVSAADLFTMFVFWELTSVCSFLLIGLNDRSESARVAAVRALLTTGAGGLCLLGGVALLQVSQGTTDFDALVASPPSGAMAGAAAGLILVGAFTKSAQFPFHFWLPGAMAAPTPVSAYLHSATMVKAGIVLLARTAPAFSDAAAWRWAVVVAGGTTMLVGGAAALRQVDVKLLLAHSTVSQLGLLAILFGSGDPKAAFAGTAHLLAHAVFKMGLFLGIGAIDHETGSRHVARLAEGRRALPLVGGSFAMVGASMAGIVPMLGFVSKEKSLAALLDADLGNPGTVALLAATVGMVLSVAYSVRLLHALLRRVPVDRVVADQPAPVHGHGDRESWLVRAALHAPVLLAAVASLVLGIAAPATGRWIASAASAANPRASSSLSLWPGFNVVLAVSVAVLVVGFLIGFRAPIEPSRSWKVRGERAFDAVYAAILSGAKRLTGVIQTGSLPMYTTVFLAVLGGVLAVSVVSGWDSVTAPSSLGAPLAVVIALLTGAFALSVAIVPVRFTAAFLLGGVGFGIAVLFAMRGAPDLALTQLLVETLTIVMFLIALRALPRRFAPSPTWSPRPVRIVVACAIGVLVPLFALAASGARSAPSVAGEYMQRSVPEAGGRNVVNVILVDFRGFDTMGEITVLAIAALGVVNLVRVAERQRRARSTDGGVR